MKFLLVAFLAVFLFSGQALGTDGPVSEESTACMECHSTLNPGIVSAWKKSRMSRVIPRAAASVEAKQRRISFEQIPENLANVVVGCAECHTLNSENHRGRFDHNGYKVNVVVTPRDCATCHTQTWVEGHFERFENTIRKTNEMTLAATNVLPSAWEKGAASQKDGLFNEAIEKRWVEQWLFYANSTRFSPAMAGADYGVFANGRWFMAKDMQEMLDWLTFKSKFNASQEQ